MAPLVKRIVHLDADAFFAAVEQAADPRLRGRPVAVGGERRGIIASASYEARRFGIYTPMPTARARKLCPNLVLLPGDFEKYERFSRWMFSYAYDFTPDVEICSIDEGYVDLSGVRRDAVEVAGTIRDAIRQALKLNVSEGIGASKLVSQIASKLHKPAAFVHVPAGHETGFLHPLPNRWLPGVGPKTAERLNAAGLACIRHVAATPVEFLHLLVGSAAPVLRQFAHGIDERPVIPASQPAKSYSQQETFAEDQTDAARIEATLRCMADRLFAKVRADAASVRTLTVKVRYQDMDEAQASESLSEPTDLETDVYGRLSVLLRRAWQRRVSLRLVALKLSQLYRGWLQGELALEESARQREARRRLAAAVDDLRQRHGARVLLRGHDFERARRAAAAGAGADADAGAGAGGTRRMTGMARAAVRQRKWDWALPLAVRSYYSFLSSTLSIEGLIALAKRQGLPAVALADQGNLHAAVAFTQQARAAGLRPVLGAEVALPGGRPLWLFVENAAGYRNLCRLLSQATAAPEARPGVGVDPERLRDANDGLIAVGLDGAWAAHFPGRFYLGVDGPEALRAWEGRTGRVPLVALPVVCYGAAAERAAFDVVQSIRTRTLLRQAHPDKLLDGAHHFPVAGELADRFREWPDVLDRSCEIAERCRFELALQPPQFPAFQPPEGGAPRAYLRRLVLAGLQQRYGARGAVTDTGARVSADALRAQVEVELGIIHEVGYEEYFLVVWDLLQTCRGEGIEWITRGSAADSLVCYSLGISDVCPIRFGLYFRRFLNKERMALNKLPDIDVDFAHDRKDAVVELMFAKYGAEHCAVVGGFSTYQARSALGDVAKVLGVAEHQIRRLTRRLPWSGAAELRAAVAASPECRDLPLDEEPYRTALEMAALLDGFPRHPKMHPCGVVLSRQPMRELTPTFVSGKGWPATQFDMDAVEAIGLVKLDVLAQGGLAVMRDVRSMLRARGIEVDLQRCEARRCGANGRVVAAAAAPFADPAVWELIAGGQGRAVHHIESPAMTGLCRMCDVRDVDTLIAIVSVIRPGAANENKKLEFTRRYQGLAPVTYPHPSLEPCLRSSYGLVVYEEQILQICEAFAGLPGGRADVLRRALGKENTVVIAELERAFRECARGRGHSEALIERVWGMVEGFRGYAFCKAHSTAYGVEAYQSAWLKRYFPAEFMAAVLTHGKGFYAPLVYVLECWRLGIGLLPPWVNEPGPGFQVVDGPAGPRIRVPVASINGLSELTRAQVLAARAHGPFVSMADFQERVRAAPEELETMIRAGAFDGFGAPRTAQFWQAQALRQARHAGGAPGQGWLLPAPDVGLLLHDRAHGGGGGGSAGAVPPFEEPSRGQRLQWEAELLGYAASGHPLELHADVAWETYCPINRLHAFTGQAVTVCGLIIEDRVHHQTTGEPMKFLTLADWTGMLETELFAKTYRRDGLATVRYPVLEVSGVVEPFENGRGHTLHVHRAGPPRLRQSSAARAAGAAVASPEQFKFNPAGARVR
jgi:DNA-directed DNA polymerase III PolC